MVILTLLLVIIKIINRNIIKIIKGILSTLYLVIKMINKNMMVNMLKLRMMNH